MARLAGRTAIVTGAASGIGRATASLLAAEGAAVAVADINGEGAEEVADAIRAQGGSAIAVPTDVRDEAAIADLVARTVSELGRLDVLHNNAADLSLAKLDEDVVTMDVELWDSIMAANLRSVMLGCKHAIPAMLASGGGSIVNTGSVAGLAGQLGSPAYSASKGGIVALTRNVAANYGKRGIRCNCVCPGTIVTPAVESQFTAEAIARVETTVLTPRVGRPEDIAAAVVFLASDEESGYMTGQVLTIDGGRLAHFRGSAAMAREAAAAAAQT